MTPPGKPGAVLFDLDGTLVDTAPDFHAVLSRLCQAHGRTAPDFNTLNAVVSEGGRAMVTLAFGLPQDHPEFLDLHRAFLNAYSEQACHHSRLYEGADALLNWLDSQTLPWGIVTNKPRRFTEVIVDTLKLRPHAVVCPDDVPRAKPAPDALLKACDALGTETAATWYVGDHPRDVEAGQAAGCPTVGATWGYISDRHPPESWGADVLIPSPIALLNLLKQTLKLD